MEATLKFDNFFLRSVWYLRDLAPKSLRSLQDERFKLPT